MERISIKTWLIISIIINVFLLITCWRDESDNINVKYIKSHPIDTMWQGDSAYVIKYKINTVYYDPAPQEQKYDQY